MYKVEYSESFVQWFKRLKDPMIRRKIEMRLRRAAEGNFGNHKRLNEFLWEMKDMVPAGFRIYYTLVGDRMCVIISGGFKASQSADIAFATQHAQLLAEDYKNDRH